MNYVGNGNYEQGPEAISREWPLPNQRAAPRLVFMKRGMQRIIRQEVRPTTSQLLLSARKHQLLEAFKNSTERINVSRAEMFVRQQGLRIAPYRLLDEADTQQAKEMGELDDELGIYNVSLDLALVPRYPKLEAVNGTEFTESILVHELAHGSNEHHNLVYLQKSVESEPVLHHARSGQRVLDSSGESHGGLSEEANAERQRGKFVKQELGYPGGFANTKFYLDDGAVVAGKYTYRGVNGKPRILPAAFVAQAFDILCYIDPGLDRDLTYYARKTAQGLRNVARRLNYIQPGLYTYLRDTPFGHDSYKERLIHVQRLANFVLGRKARSV